MVDYEKMRWWAENEGFAAHLETLDYTDPDVIEDINVRGVFPLAALLDSFDEEALKASDFRQSLLLREAKAQCGRLYVALQRYAKEAKWEPRPQDEERRETWAEVAQ